VLIFNGFLDSDFFFVGLGVSFDLSDKEIFCIEEQEVFDHVYSLVKGFSSLTPSGKVNLVESLRSNLSVLLPNVDSLLRVFQGQDDDNDNGNETPPVLDRVSSYRNALKIYTFFLVSIVLSEESSASSNNKTKVIYLPLCYLKGFLGVRVILGLLFYFFF